MSISVAGDGLDVLLIDGELRAASDAAVFETVNPATEETLGVAADAGPADADAAVGAARRAFDDTEWANDHEFRARCLDQLREALVSEGESMRSITTAEAGAPVALTAGPQYDIPVGDLAFAAGMARDYDGWRIDLGAAEPMGMPTRRWVLREAAGVVAAIVPWNFPHQITLAKVGPALAAGCTVVVKAAPDTPWCASALARIAAEQTDLPPGVLNVITSSDHAIGSQLVADRRVDVVSFTGSTVTGKAVMAAAAPNITKVFLELGGKSASVALGDADMASAASMTAVMAMTHAGQGCAISTRLVVPRDRYVEAAEIAAATMSAMGAGDPTDPGTFCGPLISARQRDRVEGYLATVEAEGGSFVTGGGRTSGFDRGYFIDPTVVVGLDNSSTVARQEIFGPVLTVIAHDGDDDAVAIANDSPFGLSGAVWSADRDRAWGAARRIRTGTLSVNGGIWYSADVPFGGYKQSGIGREMGVAGFEEYLETKVIAEGV